MKVHNTILEPFKALHNKVFAKLYLAQTISLIGDAFTWVGLALLAYQIGREKSVNILATALTLRVTAFIIFSPFAGVLADKFNRKKILYVTHFIRMVIVACFPFISEVWQIYILVFLLNVFNAFFTPTYRAVLPQITEGRYYREAVGLSTATYQLLGILAPALAGIVAVWLGAREIFLIDAASFIIAAFFILSISSDDLKIIIKTKRNSSQNNWSEIMKGIRLLFGNNILRFALSIEFVSAIAGAMILVNTINHIKTNLLLSDKYYGYVMAAFGIGAALSAFVAGNLDKSKTRATSLIAGVFVLGLSICFANYVSFAVLSAFWLFAGLGQSLAEMPSETLIGETIPSAEQGKVYGSHFALSHLWWAISYPIAGLLGTNFPKNDFFIGGLLTLFATFATLILFRKRDLNQRNNSVSNINN